LLLWQLAPSGPDDSSFDSNGQPVWLPKRSESVLITAELAQAFLINHWIAGHHHRAPPSGVDQTLSPRAVTYIR